MENREVLRFQVNTVHGIAESPSMRFPGYRENEIDPVTMRAGEALLESFSRLTATDREQILRHAGLGAGGIILDPQWTHGSSWLYEPQGFLPMSIKNAEKALVADALDPTKEVDSNRAPAKSRTSRSSSNELTCPHAGLVFPQTEQVQRPILMSCLNGTTIARSHVRHSEDFPASL